MELTVNCKVHFSRGRKGRKEMSKGEKPIQPVINPGNIPRVSRLMALAIRLQKLIRSGEISNYSDIARLGQVSRARVTQIMNLLLLAPDIQEEILFLPRTLKGHDLIRERDLRTIVTITQWDEQLKMWEDLIQNRLMS